MKIDKSKLLTLWYENDDGDRITHNDYNKPLPKGFKYQHSQFPRVLRHNVLELVQSDEVEMCEHPERYIRETFGWIEGIEGRECIQCKGTQVKPIEEDWPKKWDADGARPFLSADSSWPEDLVLKMANSGDYTLSESIMVAANCCERCVNTLGHQYGLTWGYAYRSKDWYESNTMCDFCMSYKFDEIPMPKKRRII